MFKHIALRQIHLKDGMQVPTPVFVRADWHRQADCAGGLRLIAIAKQIIVSADPHAAAVPLRRVNA
ncbi:hypothetical protein TU82_13925 [Pseudomonas orientalis]|nr:hypothetical protein TU82_13925 [Pseudomonas orientalis]